MNRLKVFALHASAPLIVSSGIILGTASSVNAAVFVLKDVSFTVNQAAENGTYSITGEFKVDTSGATQRPSAWNINITSTSGTNGLNASYVSNTTGFTDNSFTAFTANARGFTLCKTVSAFCDNNLFLSFNTNFKNVYQDATTSASAVPGATGTTTFDNINLTLSGTVYNNTSSRTGQADFVPFSPAFVGFLPLAGLIIRLRQKHAI